MQEFVSSFKELFNEYVDYRKIGNKWNDSYHQQLISFDRHCSTYPDEKSINQAMVDSWCAQHPNESSSSCRKRIYPIYGFLKYCIENKYIAVQLPLIPRNSKTIVKPHPFTIDELKNFFKECDALKNKSSKNLPEKLHRLTIPVYFRLMYSSGIRPVEARYLKRHQVNLETGVVDIQIAKGRHQRFIVLHDSILGLMKQYDDRINRYLPNREYFFSNCHNTHFSNRWGTDNFNKIWKAANPGINARLYDLRHNYAIRNINSWIGMGFEFHDKLVYLSKSMGHHSVEETKYYYSMVPALADIIRNCSEASDNWMIPEVITDEEI